METVQFCIITQITQITLLCKNNRIKIRDKIYHSIVTTMICYYYDSCDMHFAKFEYPILYYSIELVILHTFYIFFY